VRRGEAHWKATASDDVVRWARNMRELEHWTYGQIAQTLSQRLGRRVLRNTVLTWCTYKRRVLVPAEVD